MDPPAGPRVDDADSVAPTPPRKQLIDLASHLGLYAAAQVILVFFDLSWIAHLFTDDPLEILNGTNRNLDGLISILYAGSKIWAIILMVDALWTSSKTVAVSIRRSPAG